MYGVGLPSVCRETGKGTHMEKMVSLESTEFYIETTFGSGGLGFRGHGGRGSGCRVYASGVEAFSV